MLDFLFHDKSRYLRSLNELAAACPRAANLLEQGFAKPHRFPELALTIKAIGTEAGSTSVALHARIEQAFTLPINREDIHHIAAGLKRIV